MTSDSLPPAPTPEAEEPELLPGGADSIDDPRYGSTFGEPTTPDLPQELIPDVHNVVPDEVMTPDDKPQAPEADSGSGETPDEPTD